MAKIHVQREESEARGAAPIVKKFGPHRPSDGDSPQQKGGSDEVSLSFKGEQFQGFSVFASPAPPVRRKSSKDLK